MMMMMVMIMMIMVMMIIMMMMAAVTLEDYIRPCCGNMSDSKVAVLVQVCPAFISTSLLTIYTI